MSRKKPYDQKGRNPRSKNKNNGRRQERIYQQFHEMGFMKQNKQHDNYYHEDEFEARQRNKPKPIKLSPRSENQQTFISSMEDPEIFITAGVGPAGCGKTYLATMYAIQQFRSGMVDRIVITRPAVSVDEQHGFLPGGVNKKMEPWLMPIIDVFKKFYNKREIDKLMNEGLLEVAPLAYMRGRDFGSCVIIADEIQLTTPSQLKMLLTRIGEGSKIIVTGDLKQSDRMDDNGLKDFIEKMKKNDPWGINVVYFNDKDIQRHPVIAEVLKIYGD